VSRVYVTIESTVYELDNNKLSELVKTLSIFSEMKRVKRSWQEEESFKKYSSVPVFIISSVHPDNPGF